VYLTAQRVISAGGESGINGFLYEHGTVAWETPPEPIGGAIGELVHTFIMVPQGGNKVMSYVDVVAPDGTLYESIRERVFPWMVAQASAGHSLPWTGVVEDMRFGLHMISTYAKTWKSEVAKLLMTCQMTLDRYTLPASTDTMPSGDGPL
jgi:hypothetical protein